MMASESAQVVQKLWSYCHVLRDDVEQLTFLLFLKMAHEQTQPPWSRASPVPKDLDWPSLTAKDGDALEIQYRVLSSTVAPAPRLRLDLGASPLRPDPRSCRHILEKLGKESLNVFWLTDESLEVSAKLADPDVIAGEVADDPRAAVEQFEAIQTDLARSRRA